MSFSEESSDPEWKETRGKRIKTEKMDFSGEKPKYSQKFCEKWLKIFDPWLTRCEDDTNKPFCRACQVRLDCNRCHLQRHERTAKHGRNLEILICKGESAARQNLSIRQERSKYYQQRKKLSSSLMSSDLGVDADDFIEETDADAETNFQFVHTDGASGDQFSEESLLKQEAVSVHTSPASFHRTNAKQQQRTNVRNVAKKVSVGPKKERMKLFMQIQKDKNDLMDSFKELIGGGVLQTPSPPKEKNHVDLFFESVSSTVKQLDPKLIAEAKMRVSQLVCELELRGLTENDNSSANTASAAVVVQPDGGNAYIINQPVTVHDGA